MTCPLGPPKRAGCCVKKVPEEELSQKEDVVWLTLRFRG